ncbi:Yfh7p [Sporobolomyces salmoneus]|uniref:Yfh7p n=1 Tax=Sporobolomyces salmoneus TaxID=183962 RepID=UPI003173DAE0
MERAISQLGSSVLERLSEVPKEQRVLVGIAGAPGSGKSTLAYPLVDYLNKTLGEENVAVAVGLDGWHFSRAELDRFANPEEARRRRGAAFTFDAVSYLSFVRSLRCNPVLPSVPFPVFSHAVKDPTDSPSPILPSHRIVVIEGLYTLLDVDPWAEATKELDVKVWVECDKGVARERLIERHLESGIEPNREAAERRVDGSDMVNGEYIREHLIEPDFSLNTAAKQDLVDLLQETLEGEEPCDVNYQDGLGNTALHYAASSPSPDALQLLLEFDGTDVDLQNRLDRATPLHLAVKLENEDARLGVIEMLLDAGANPSIKDRHGLKLADYLHPNDSETDKQILQLIRAAIAEATMGGVANNADLADDDDDAAGGSGSESD